MDEPAAVRAPSRREGMSVRQRAVEAVRLLRWARKVGPRDYGYVLDGLEEFDEILRRHGATPLDDARVFEVGYGARPYRLRALRARGVDALGVDAEVPALRGRPSEYLRMLRTNGPSARRSPSAGICSSTGARSGRSPGRCASGGRSTRCRSSPSGCSSATPRSASRRAVRPRLLDQRVRARAAPVAGGDRRRDAAVAEARRAGDRARRIWTGLAAGTSSSGRT